MASILWVTISASFGLLCFLAIPFLSVGGGPRMRNRVAQFYWGQAARSIGKIALVWRNVGGPSLFQLKIDDQKGAGYVTLDDSVLGDPKELHFEDPDNRMKRWKRKPFVMVHEMVAGVVDPELGELGYHLRQYDAESGLAKGDKADPYFAVPKQRRAVTIDDVHPLVINGSEPTDASTMVDFTRNRFAKYKDNVGAVEIISTFTGFAIGVGGVAALQYFQRKIIDGGGGTEPQQPVPVGTLADGLDGTIQLVVMAL